MGRPALPDPRAVTVAAKISARRAGQVDAARGRQSRSAWIAAVIDRELDALYGPVPAADPRAATPKPARARKPRAAATTAKPCAHRGLQPGAYCRSCDSTVPD